MGDGQQHFIRCGKRKCIPAGQRKGSSCVKSRTYQGALTKYELTSSSTQAGHAESTPKTFTWL